MFKYIFISFVLILYSTNALCIDKIPEEKIKIVNQATSKIDSIQFIMPSRGYISDSVTTLTGTNYDKNIYIKGWGVSLIIKVYFTNGNMLYKNINDTRINKVHGWEVTINDSQIECIETNYFSNRKILIGIIILLVILFMVKLPIVFSKLKITFNFGLITHYLFIFILFYSLSALIMTYVQNILTGPLLVLLFVFYVLSESLLIHFKKYSEYSLIVIYGYNMIINMVYSFVSLFFLLFNI